MKLSVRGEYGLRALEVLAGLGEGEVTRVQAIAEAQNIPKRFLEQILHDLRRGGVVESRRGVTGGHRLARPAEQITLAEVIRHLDGAIAPVSCVSERFYEPCSCPDEARCALRSIMKEVRDLVSERMEQTTVADLRTRAQELRARPSETADYSI